jgi:hypothetical protein
MRSRFSRFAHEAPAPLGHNLGPPLDAGYSWRRHVWKKAKKAAIKQPPIEVVRRRVRRAKQLGLEYPQYASILMGSGRDVRAFLFTAEAIGMRVLREIRMDEAKARKLEGLLDCDRLLLAPAGEDAAACAAALSVVGGAIAAAGPGPTHPVMLRAGAKALREVLDPLKLPGDAVVMIGATAEERDWADAARLAKFLTAESYFGANP